MASEQAHPLRTNPSRPYHPRTAIVWPMHRRQSVVLCSSDRRERRYGLGIALYLKATSIRVSQPIPAAMHVSINIVHFSSLNRRPDSLDSLTLTFRFMTERKNNEIKSKVMRKRKVGKEEYETEIADMERINKAIQKESEKIRRQQSPLPLN